MAANKIHPAAGCGGVQQLNLCGFFGKTFRRKFTWMLRNEQGIRQPMPLDGVTGITATFREPLIDTDPPTRQLTIGSGMAITDAAGGEFTMTIADTDITSPETDEFYDIEFVFNGTEYVLFPVVGVFEVRAVATS